MPDPATDVREPPESGESTPSAIGSTSRQSAASTLRAILAEFAVERTEAVPLGAVVASMAEAGYSAEAARQAVSRAARRGALLGPPWVRRGEVLLEDDARSTLRLAAAATVTTAAEPEPWDGTWTLVLLRGTGGATHPHRVRSALLLEGLGALGNGAWVTPHTLRSERLIALLNEDPDLNLAVCQATFDYPSDAEIAKQAWDLPAIRAEYESFLALVAGLRPDTDAQRLAAWIVLARQWHHVARMDPGIPTDALDSAWPARDARRLVVSRRADWRPGAERHFESLVTDFQK